MARQKSSRSFLTVVPLFALALAAAACDSGEPTDDSNDWSTSIGGGAGGSVSGGSTGSTPGGGTGSAAGGSASGGTASGGAASGGAASGLFGGALPGGLASGGAAPGGAASGGSASGGSASGGSASGGSASGGSASGGSASGGSASGGSASGGSASGGSASGGTASGGSASGGSASGGTASGGTASGGTASGGTASGGTAGGRTGGSTTGGGGTFSGLFGGGGSAGGTPVDRTAGDCCKGDDCSKCITEPPANVSGAQRGPWGGGLLGGGGRTFEVSEATVYVPPADAKGPWAGFAIIPGFTNVGPEMAAWGPFFSGWGIVTAVTYSGPLDTPGLRGQWLLDAIEALKKAGTSNQMLMGKLSGNYGTGGYSMGGGGTTVASTSNKALRSSIGLAPWTPVGAGIVTPTIHFCGTVDIVADCSHSEWSYADIPSTTPKALITVSGCDHLTCWFGPADSTGGVSGQMGLIWNKVYLEGDSRWKKLLLDDLKGGLSYTVETNVK